jgi:hypothetical protein
MVPAHSPLTIFGAICAFLLDIRWLVLGIVFGGLLTARCAHAEVLLPRTLAGTGYTITILDESFTCKFGWHRALRQSDTEGPLGGCASIDDETDGILIVWDNGHTFELPPDWRWYPDVEEDTPSHNKDTPVRPPEWHSHPPELKA